MCIVFSDKQKANPIPRIFNVDDLVTVPTRIILDF